MKKLLLGIIVLLIGIIVFIMNNKPAQIQSSVTDGDYRYIPIGDSYTIGNGLTEQERWPNVLVDHLKKDGIAINLVTNPAVSGWTTQMALDYQIPVLKKENATFTTILIGANDAFSRRPPEEFHEIFKELLDEVEKIIPDKKILLITLPDYSLSPQTQVYLTGDQEGAIIEQYNSIINEEARLRRLPVADIFPVSQKIASEEGMFIEDGLHPSGKQVKLWEEIIRTQAVNLLKNK